MTSVIPAIVKTVTVPLPPAAAFALFTERVHAWWPLATHSCGGASSTGLRLTPEGFVETLADGSTTDWGEVLDWRPPHRVAMTWHPGQAAGADATQVTVTFEATDGGTLVRLEHTGWERTNPQRQAGYSTGWDVVLDAYVTA